MESSTVFDGVLHREVAFTRVFANLLNLSVSFRASVFSFFDLAPSELLTVHTEVSLENGGRVDIELWGAEVKPLLRLECKVRSETLETSYQRSGYEGVHWLVPRNWNGRRDVIARGRTLRTLEEFAVHLGRDEGLRDDPIALQFLTYLELLYPTIRFSNEEIMAMRDSAFIRSAIKLHRVVDALCARFNEVQGLTVDTRNNSDDEYGCYIKRGQRHLLWFGIWASEGLLLGVGYQSNVAATDMEQFRRSTNDSNWRLRELSVYLDSGDPVEELFRTIHQLLEMRIGDNA